MKNTTVSALGKGTILSIQSHVAYGHVGNCAATFPLQRLGYNVTSINTVLFSNHTGYGDWTGSVIDVGIVSDLLLGVEKRGVFEITQAVISGYMGETKIGKLIVDAVGRVRRKNPAAIYVCDPVIGDVGRGIFVRKGIPEYFRDVALLKCDICTPNIFELQWLTNRDVDTIGNILAAARYLLHRDGSRCEIVLVTSVKHSNTKKDTIEMLAVTKDRAWRVVTPEVKMAIAPNGSGDATTAIFTAWYLEAAAASGSRKGIAVETVLEKTAGSIYEIFENTAESGTRELQIVRSGDGIKNPKQVFEASRVD